MQGNCANECRNNAQKSQCNLLLGVLKVFEKLFSESESVEKIDRVLTVLYRG
jgi:hypothetical protein